VLDNDNKLMLRQTAYEPEEKYKLSYEIEKLKASLA
jgi:hypothetical protein